MFTDKNKKINHLTIKNILFIITYAVVLIWIVLNIKDVLHAILTVVGLLKPFIYGVSMAFVFNLPLTFFLKKLPDSLKKFKKGVAALLSLIVIITVITFIIQIVVPQVIESVTALANSLPGYISSAEDMLMKAIENKDIPEEFIKQLSNYSSQVQTTILHVIKDGLPHVLTFASGFASSVANVFLALVIAVYLTISKDKLIEQSKRFLYAFTSQRVNTFILKVGHLTTTTFSAFITGQMVEAIIIGILCYIGCLIFRFPYAPILGVIIGCTNIIPIFGAIFGTGLCGLLVAFVNPLQGLLFLVFGICLQQFESNLIYPRVVGTSVGLSGLWVLFAITLGGGLFGFFGMLLGLPTFSVLYTLLREEMNRRVAVKNTGHAEIMMKNTFENVEGE